MKKGLLSVALFAISGMAQAQLFNVSPAVASGATNHDSAAISANAAVSDELQNYFAATQDLQSDFKQTVYSQRGGENSQGKLWVSKPGKFYLDYQGKNAQKIISNGSKVWQYDIELEQIAIRGRDELVGNVAMDLLSGTRQLQELFNYQLMTDHLQAPMALQTLVKGGELYRLTPLSEQEGYDNVWLVMKNQQLTALAVDAGRGQQTILELQNLKRNVGIPASQFEFTPPKGIDVIGE